jgi:parallel beta-helix repeat protein
MMGSTRTIVVTLGLIAMATANTSGRTFYANPSLSVTQLAAKLKPGDVLVLKPGIYREEITISGLRGTPEQPIKLVGEKGAIVESPGRDGIHFFGGGGSEQVLIDGLTIRKARRAGILVNGSRHITIRNCTIGDNGQWGIQTILSDAITVEDCDLYGSVKQHGIYFSTTDHPVVRRCRIHDNAACGVHFNGDKSEGGDGMISRGVVEDNVIYRNGRLGGAGINMDSAEFMLIRNNLLHHNLSGGITAFTQNGLKSGNGNRILFNTVYFAPKQGRFGVQVVGNVAKSVIEDNVLVCGKGPALHLDTGSVAGLVADRNLYFVHSKQGPVMIDEKRMSLKKWRRLSGADKSSRSVNPLFENPDGDDFHFKADSPVHPLRGDP